jgi:DNA-binding NarL/FixJ family response regulator
VSAERIRLVLRSCFRCGSDFESESDGCVFRICPDCREMSKNQEKPLKPKLSFREMQVVKLVAQAESNKEIAYQLRLTEGTVKEYMWRIFRKTGASNRVALAVWFVKEHPAS